MKTNAYTKKVYPYQTSHLFELLQFPGGRPRTLLLHQPLRKLVHSMSSLIALLKAFRSAAIVG